MKLKKFFIALIIFSAIFMPSTFAEESKPEGIFIETISELNKSNLTVNEVRTRPTNLSTSAKKIPVEADGVYISESGLQENSLVAQDRARLDAKRALSEQISVYIKSVSEMKNGKITRDEIHTLAVVAVQIESENISVENIENDAVKYRCHVKAFVDETNIFYQLDAVGKDNFHKTVRRTIEIEKETARLNAELNELKKKYKNANSVGRAEINARLKINEKNFTAIMLNEQAYIANYQCNFDKAVEYCYKAIEFNAVSSDAWNNLGYAYNYKGNIDKALECYRRAIILAPNDATPLINIGSVYDSMQNFEESMKFYEAALKIEPNNVDALNNLGYVYMQKGNFDKGIEYCKKAVEFDARYAAAWNGLGYSYNQKKKFYKAIECCRKAVGLDKNYANAWNNLGYACSKVSRLEDSYAAYRNAVKIAPNVELYVNNFKIALKRIESFKSL